MHEFFHNRAKHIVDYSGQESAYLDARKEYRAGETVTVYYYGIATDTAYSFFLDGTPLQPAYDAQRGYKLQFVMPAHDVRLQCVKRNTMICDAGVLPVQTDAADAKE